MPTIDLTKLEAPEPNNYRGTMKQPVEGKVTDKKNTECATLTLEAEIEALRSDGSKHVVSKKFRMDKRGQKSLKDAVQKAIGRPLHPEEIRQFDVAKLVTGVSVWANIKSTPDQAVFSFRTPTTENKPAEVAKP